MDRNRQRHYRHAYFALVKTLGLSDDDRHALNHAMTGHDSTRDFDEPDWCAVVARLQQLNGQDAGPGDPHLKLPRKEHEDEMERAFLEAGLPVDAATDAQVRFLRTLSTRVAWREPDGLERLIRKRVLAADVRREQWDASLQTLTGTEAGLAIRILLRMTGDRKEGPQQPVEA